MTIEDELLQIKSSQEFLKAEEVVEWAGNHKRSELHKQFEWDDSEAAKEYRIWQARRIIALHIVNVDGVRSMVSLSIDRSRVGGGYRALDDILSDRSLHSVMMDDALAELKRMQAKYDTLSQLKPIWRAAAKVAAAHKRKGKGKRRGTEVRATA